MFRRPQRKVAVKQQDIEERRDKHGGGTEKCNRQ
jgi:hypothetical protein